MPLDASIAQERQNKNGPHFWEPSYDWCRLSGLN